MTPSSLRPRPCPVADSIAVLAWGENRPALDVGRWRASRSSDRDSLRNRSSLGRLLHHRGDDVPAIEVRQLAAQREDHALWLVGWSLLEPGLQDRQANLIGQGTQTLVAAVQRWALNHHDHGERVASWGSAVVADGSCPGTAVVAQYRGPAEAVAARTRHLQHRTRR